MSTNENDVWIENCYSNFQGYVETGNYEMAKAAIEDMRDVSVDSARAMQLELDLVR